MTEQSPYAALLVGLEAKRDELTAAINVIRREMGLQLDDTATAPPTGGSQNGHAGTASGELRTDTFFGMKIPDAIRQYLSMTKRPQKAALIARALTDGGLQNTSKNFLNTVQTTLVRMRPSVVRLPNGWGMAEWYPGRTFDKPAAAVPKKKAESKTRRKPGPKPKVPTSEQGKTPAQ